MTDLQRMQTLVRCDLFKDPIYRNLYKGLKESYSSKDYKSFDYYASKFPTEEQLFNTLCAKLEKKSVGTTLKSILEGKATNKYTQAKAYSSILTHAIISCEQGQEEYKILFEGLIGKIIGSI